MYTEYDYNNSIYHSALSHSAKGSTWKKDTKYISKKMINGNWKYIYNVVKDADNKARNAIAKDRETSYRINGKKTANEVMNKYRLNKKSKEIEDYNKSLVSRQKQIVNDNNNRIYKKREEASRIQGTTFGKSLIKNPIKLTAQQKRLKEREMDARLNGRKKIEETNENKRKARKVLDKDMRDYPFKYKTKNMSKDEDMRIISQNYYRTSMNNPAWKEDSIAFSRNCSASTLAYYMRRKGFDVLPNRGSLKEFSLDNSKRNSDFEDKRAGAFSTEIFNWSKNFYEDHANHEAPVKILSKDLSYSDYQYLRDKNAPEEYKNKKADYCIDTVKNYDGDIGFVTMSWLNGSSHAIIWEKEGDDVIFRDCQVGKVMKNDQVRDYTDHALDIMIIDPKGYKLDPSVVYWLKNKGQ